ncbi:ABC transporter permease [Paenibacillus sp. 598K]|uniref:hypothetical protein n=1 Tax=Paenibacillus sp. 598K TaxID=1117987 RepID=UPI000FF90045|nr:hypothetical protein [Paenibacillus sp. 598K]GBF74968.1 ABC transporter permease [Paenibacillus sp. 598K]
MQGMLVLLRMELYKLVCHRWLPVACLGIAAAAIAQATVLDYGPPVSAWEDIARFPYASGAVYEVLLLLLVLPTIYNGERRWSMLPLLHSTRWGRSRALTAKMLAAGLYTTGVVLGCWLLGLAVHLSAAGVAGWALPIQTLPDYADAPWSLSIWQYTLIQLATNWLGCMAYMLLIVWLSARCRSPLTVMFAGGMVFAVSVLIHNHSDFSLPWALKSLTMIEVLRVENVFSRPRFVHIGDLTLTLPPAWFLLHTLLLAVGCAILAYRTAARREVA